ncbi:UNVERIFIED_CONTAM: hypothetical protein RMT77_008010 [Armadillidium vulgare]
MGGQRRSERARNKSVNKPNKGRPTPRKSTRIRTPVQEYVYESDEEERMTQDPTRVRNSPVHEYDDEPDGEEGATLYPTGAQTQSVEDHRNRDRTVTPETRELKEAKKMRRAQRLCSTRIIEELETLLMNEEPARASLSELIQTLEGTLIRLEQGNAVIQQDLEGDDFIADYSDCFEFQRSIQRVINRAKEVLGKLERREAEERAPTPSSGTPCCAGGGRPPGLFKPPMKRLPSFSGDPIQFSSFIELFESMVEGHGYADVEKLEALFSCLQGDAKQLVGGYALKGENYPIVLNLLKEDFGDKSKLIECLISKLTGLRPPSIIMKSFTSLKPTFIASWNP